MQTTLQGTPATLRRSMAKRQGGNRLSANGHLRYRPASSRPPCHAFSASSAVCNRACEVLTVETEAERWRCHRHLPRRSWTALCSLRRGGTLILGRILDPVRLGDHLDRLYRAAWALSGSREDAEDLVQGDLRARAQPPTPAPQRGRPRLPPARAAQHLSEPEACRAPPAASTRCPNSSTWSPTRTHASRRPRSRRVSSTGR